MTTASGDASAAFGGRYRADFFSVVWLNAIGAKADSSGYAAPGGTMPVIKVGRYDNTAYFADGGLRASVIEKPGEYSELRA